MSSNFRRRENIREENKIIYIFAEGKKTEPIYFRSKKEEIEDEIRRKGIKIEIKGSGRNTLSLVDFAMKYIADENVDLGIDDCWVVFDKDDFDSDFDNAILKAKRGGLKVAYSNEAFELWFLLHFSFINSAVGRHDYVNKLTQILKKVTGDRKYEYKKNTDIYSLIKDKEVDAIRNSKKLLQQYDKRDAYRVKNPSTTVHELVEDLNDLKE